MKTKPEFKVSQITNSPLSKLLEFYLLIGLVNRTEADPLEDDIELQASFELNSDSKVVACLLDHKRLTTICDVYEPRSRRWPGQYQALVKANVSALKGVVTS